MKLIYISAKYLIRRKGNIRIKIRINPIPIPKRALKRETSNVIIAPLSINGIEFIRYVTSKLTPPRVLTEDIITVTLGSIAAFYFNL